MSGKILKVLHTLNAKQGWVDWERGTHGNKD